jgi:hypothetical protein
LKGWRTYEGDRGKWRFENGALTTDSTAWIARSLSLPPILSLEFTVTWKESIHFYLSLWHDGSHWDRDDYGISFQNDRVTMHRYSPTAVEGKRERYFKTLETREFSRPASKRVRILANRTSRQINLLLDGRVVMRWCDPEKPEMLGDGIMFQPVGNSGGIELSDIKVSAWDGKLPP